MSKKVAKRFCTVLTSVPDRALCDQITDALLEAALAACVQVVPIESRYTWKGRIVRHSEFLMLIKARRQDFSGVKKAILKIHTYKVPEIASIPFEDGLGRYFDWMAEVTK